MEQTNQLLPSLSSKRRAHTKQASSGWVALGFLTFHNAIGEERVREKYHPLVYAKMIFISRDGSKRYGYFEALALEKTALCFFFSLLRLCVYIKYISQRWKIVCSTALYLSRFACIEMQEGLVTFYDKEKLPGSLKALLGEQKCGAEFRLLWISGKSAFCVCEAKLAIKFNKQFMSRLEFIAGVSRFVWNLFLFACHTLRWILYTQWSFAIMDSTL